MTRKEPVYFFVVLCALITLSVFMSNVNAKSIKRSVHNSTQNGIQRSHSMYNGNSVVKNNTRTHSNRTTPGHSPSGNHFGFNSTAQHSAKNSSLSGTRNSRYYPETESKLKTTPYPWDNLRRKNTSNAHSYPPSRPNSLSGGSSRSNNTSTAKHEISNHTKSVLYPPSTGNSGDTAKVNQVNKNNHTIVPSRHHVNSHQTSSKRSESYVKKSSYTVAHHHRHYIYHPPIAIYYGPQNISYPVFKGTPPHFVYEYRASSNKYRNLLAGLVLYNIGRMSATTHSHNYHYKYKLQPDEYCTFIVKNHTSKYEEMAIDCRAITYFIYEDEPRLLNYTTKDAYNRTVTTTQLMLRNGTLVVPANGTIYHIHQVSKRHEQHVPHTRHANIMAVTDHRLTGNSVAVNPDMECYVTRHTQYTNMMKPLQCELLQKYSLLSLRATGYTAKSSLIVIVASLIFVLY